MSSIISDARKLVRRSKLFVPVNREKFVAKAWTRDADCIILDLEDAVAPADKASARKMVKDVIPVVKRGGAEIQVRIPDLEGIRHPHEVNFRKHVVFQAQVDIRKERAVDVTGPDPVHESRDGTTDFPGGFLPGQAGDFPFFQGEHQGTVTRDLVCAGSAEELLQDPDIFVEA